MRRLEYQKPRNETLTASGGAIIKKNLISKRNRLHKAWSKNKNIIRARFCFKSARSKVRNEIKKCKKKVLL